MSNIIQDIQSYKKAITETERTIAQDEGSLKTNEESLKKEIGNCSENFVFKWLSTNETEMINIDKQINEKLTHLKQVFPL
jgi:hypothetical protein